MEAKAFPSDRYVVESQVLVCVRVCMYEYLFVYACMYVYIYIYIYIYIYTSVLVGPLRAVCMHACMLICTHAHTHQVKFHGFDPEQAIILLSPKEGEETLRDTDVIEAIKMHGATTALVFMP